eukprot:TRINITY_DN82728_c0_g1_i1.p1 TRINITY_DN82728_c0_g1~~TRINITY_DN82728_c0_g1_i1.p1  ORF type:complete len:239 (-),score=61.74 TRINITY_DN82728_c0_g1_i1:104-820(-)
MSSDRKSMDVKVTGMPLPVAEPAPLGLAGLAIAALVLALTDLEYAEVKHRGLMIPWAIFLGSIAQLMAGYMDFLRNNIFGATAFFTYGLLWASIGFSLCVTQYSSVTIDLRHYTSGLIAFLIFSLILTAICVMLTKLLFIILVFIDLALISLIFHYEEETSATIVGLALLGTSGFSFYGVFAIIANTIIGHPFFPLGSPIWKPVIKKEEEKDLEIAKPAPLESSDEISVMKEEDAKEV